MDQQFKQRFRECITRALQQKYGIAVDRVLILRFERDTKLSSLEIAGKPDEFVKCIYEIFGQGARTIELFLAEEVCREFEIDDKSKNAAASLSQAVNHARSKIMKDELTDK